MTPTLALINQKGGVGKTTSCVALAAYCAVKGYETLLIDGDPQGNATSGLGYDKNAPGLTTYDVLMGQATLSDAAKRTPYRQLSLCAANIDLTGAEIELVDRAERTGALRRALADAKAYDLIFIDAPPSLGLLTLNALAAATHLLIPVQAEYYALEGVGQLMKTYELVKTSVNPTLSIAGAFLTMYDKRTQLARQVEAEVALFFKDLCFNTRIPRNVRLSEAPSHGKPIHIYDRLSKGARAYEKLTRELIKRLKQEGALTR